MTGPQITPRDGPLYAVRWIRADGAVAKQKLYRTERHARAFRDKLRRGGWDVQLFQTWATWTDADDWRTPRPAKPQPEKRYHP